MRKFVKEYAQDEKLISDVESRKRQKKKRKTRFFDCLAEMSKTFILQFYCEGVRFQRWLIVIFLIIYFTQSREKKRLS